MRARLESLVAGLSAEVCGDGGTLVHDVVTDSREVTPGALFCALRGDRTDGHRFLLAAIGAGGAALLVEEAPPPLPRPVPYVQVPDTRAALPVVASRFWGAPGEQLTLVGVTGTNGKTSSVRMLESIFEVDGRAVGSLGTVSVRYRGTEHSAALTTPEADALQRTLARMRDAGVDTVVMEVSSHALARGRVATLRFAAAVFTNLTQDHLDFHGDMETYAATKQALFGPTYLDGPAVVNVADATGARLSETLQREGRRVVTYARGASAKATIRTVEEEIGLERSRLVVDEDGETSEILVPLPGDFQVENGLAAFAAARALGVSREVVCQGLAACPPVPGRLERVAPGQPIVLVDYAHTPDALDRVLEGVRPLVPGRLITVFGCGGDRDRSKRAPMARAACTHSDFVVATTDNPRSEEPEAILRDVAVGLSGRHETIVDRREAIRRAVRIAGPEDVVVVAGKGHETVQIVGDRRLPFDDREQARLALREREAGP